MVPQWIPDTKSSHSYTEMLSGGSAFQIFRVTWYWIMGPILLMKKQGEWNYQNLFLFMWGWMDNKHGRKKIHKFFIKLYPSLFFRAFCWKNVGWVWICWIRSCGVLSIHICPFPMAAPAWWVCQDLCRGSDSMGQGACCKVFGWYFFVYSSLKILKCEWSWILFHFEGSQGRSDYKTTLL